MWFLIISCRNCFAHSGSHFGETEVTLIGQPTPPPSPPALVDSSSSDEGDDVISDEEAVGDECTWAAVVESELCFFRMDFWGTAVVAAGAALPPPPPLAPCHP